MVSGRHRIPVICRRSTEVWLSGRLRGRRGGRRRCSAIWRSRLGGELTDLEQVEAKRFDLSQHAE
jgi:hypothetical protein